MSAARRLGALLVLAVPFLFFDLGVRVLATNDETRFPMLARDILAGGHWLLPCLNGTAHLNKPPLYAELIALVSWAAGAVTPATVALTSLLAALGVVGLTSWIGHRLFNAEAGLAAGLIVLTTYGVFFMARVPMPDMVLCLAITAAMGASVAAEFGGRRSALLGFYLLVSLAFWTKGPPGLLPVAAVLVNALAQYGSAGLARVGWGTGVLVLVGAVGGWWLFGLTAGGAAFSGDGAIKDLLLWGPPFGRGRGGGEGVGPRVAPAFVVGRPCGPPRHNAATDLRAIRAAVTQPARALYALDGHELVFSFYLDRPVIALADMTKFARLGGGAHDAYVIIPERALAATPAIADFRVLAGGLVNGRPVFLIGPAGDSRRPSAAPAPSDVFHAPPDGQAATTVRPRR